MGSDRRPTPFPARPAAYTLAAALAILAAAALYLAFQRWRSDVEVAGLAISPTPVATLPRLEAFEEPTPVPKPAELSAVYEVALPRPTPTQPAPAPDATPVDLRRVDPKDVEPPQRIRGVDPVYPEAARRARLAGVVVVEAVITPEGDVEDARVVRSVNPLLDQAAVGAVKQWKYEPARLRGKPIRVFVTASVTFRLN